MSMFMIYLLLKLDSLCALSFTAIIVSILAIPITCSIWGGLKSPEKEEKEPIYDRAIKRFIISAIFFIALTALVPTTKQMCAIYVIPKIANNEKIQNIGDKSLTLIEKKFEEWVNDTIEKPKEK